MFSHERIKEKIGKIDGKIVCIRVTYDEKGMLNNLETHFFDSEKEYEEFYGKKIPKDINPNSVFNLSELHFTLESCIEILKSYNDLSSKQKAFVLGYLKGELSFSLQNPLQDIVKTLYEVGGRLTRHSAQVYIQLMPMNHGFGTMSWEDYEPPKKPKKRYKSYKRGFERSRYKKSKLKKGKKKK